MTETPISQPTGAPAISPEGKKKRNSRGELFRFLAVMVAIFVVLRLFMTPFEVQGRSMTPNLHDHDRVFVNRVSYFSIDLNAVLNLLPGGDREGEHAWYPFSAPRRGDVVVLDPPVASSQPFIKRVIGLPGETVTFEDGYVYINGQRLEEPYIDGAVTFCRSRRFCEAGPVPAGMVYVLGDNRMNSEDSRYFGPVPIEDLIGRAWLTNWPVSEFGRVPSYDYDLDESMALPLRD